MMKKRYIGHWNCPTCGKVNDAMMMATDGKLIRVLHCMGCGAGIPKVGPNDGSVFWIEENIADRTVLDQKYHHVTGSPNWKCSSCEGDVPDTDDYPRCPHCGNPKDMSDQTRVKTEVGVAAPVIKEGLGLKEEHWTCTSCETETPVSDEYCSSCGAPRLRRLEKQVADETPTYTSSLPTAPKWGKLGLALLGVGILTWAILFFFIATTEKVGHIEDKTWRREVAIQDYELRHREAWEGEVPSSGTVYGSSRQVHHHDKEFSHTETKTRQVKVGERQYVCGTIDNGDGSFDDKMCTETIYGEETYTEDVYKDVPVYKTKYQYTIWDWEYDRTEETAGSVKNRDPDPYWYEVTAEREREAGRDEAYVIHILTDDGKTYTDNYSQQDWESYEIGQEFLIEVTRTGIVRKMTPK